jgi:hypothetical protein
MAFPPVPCHTLLCDIAPLQPISAGPKRDNTPIFCLGFSGFFRVVCFRGVWASRSRQGSHANRCASWLVRVSAPILSLCSKTPTRRFFWGFFVVGAVLGCSGVDFPARPCHNNLHDMVAPLADHFVSGSTTTRHARRFFCVDFSGCLFRGVLGVLFSTRQPCKWLRDTAALNLGFHFFLLLDNTPIFCLGFSGFFRVVCFRGVWASRSREGSHANRCASWLVRVSAPILSLCSKTPTRRFFWGFFVVGAVLGCSGVDFPARPCHNNLHDMVAPLADHFVSGSTTTRHARRFFCVDFSGCLFRGVLGVLFSTRQPCKWLRDTAALNLGFHFFLLLDNTPIFCLGFSGFFRVVCFRGVWASRSREGSHANCCASWLLRVSSPILSSAAPKRHNRRFLGFFVVGVFWGVRCRFFSNRHAERLVARVRSSFGFSISFPAPHNSRNTPIFLSFFGLVV